MVDNIRALASAYATTPPNELEQRLIEQGKPGWLPSGSLGSYALDAVLRGLQITDPAKYQRIKAAQINGKSEAVISSMLRGEQ
jgi:hypothetical protein